MSVVTLDGTRGTGKTSLSMRLRRKYGCIVIEIGPIFRIIAWLTARGCITRADMSAEVVGREMRKHNVRIDPAATGKLSAMRIVRKGILLERELWNPTLDAVLRRIADSPEAIDAVRTIAHGLAHGHAAIIVGREAGTSFFPEAPLKLRLVAEDAVRHARKKRQLSRAEGFRVDESEPRRTWEVGAQEVVLNTSAVDPAQTMATVSTLINRTVGWRSLNER